MALAQELASAKEQEPALALTQEQALMPARVADALFESKAAEAERAEFQDVHHFQSLPPVDELLEEKAVEAELQASRALPPLLPLPQARL